VLGLEYTRFLEVPESLDGKPGFKLVHQGKSMTIFSAPDEKVIWRMYFRMYCMNVDVHQRYTVQKLIGKGGFAKVECFGRRIF
jgi:hypothetical protein